MLHNALSDIVVLDFGQILAAPVCGMWLSDLGATVIKIEAAEGELGRKLGPPWQNGVSLVDLTANRNKLALAIDLKHSRARPVIERMVAGADVLVENFRPGVMARLGLGYDDLRAARPDLIYCSISAYGQDGPWRQRPGVDGIIQAVSGLMSSIGAEDAEPSKVPLAIADISAASFATIGILAALNERVRTGQGGFLDVSLYNSMLMLQQMNVASYLSTGTLPPRSGSAAPYAAPNEALPTKDGWIMIAAYQDKRWASLCSLIGRSDLEMDKRFSSNELRIRNRPELLAILYAVFGQDTTASWCERLNQADILCAPVANYADVVSSEQYAASGIEVRMDHPNAGVFAMPGFAIGRPEQPRRPPPLIGQHTRSVLERFGFSQGEIASLVSDGVVTGEEVS